MDEEVKRILSQIQMERMELKSTLNEISYLMNEKKNEKFSREIDRILDRLKYLEKLEKEIEKRI
jgi:flagellar motility protein MotE (MotC chaperone)